MIYLVEFDAFDPATNAVRTLRFASDGYTTRPTDAPPNTHWEERVVAPGDLEQTIFENGRTSGTATTAFGYIELALTDADPVEALDYLTVLAVDGRRLVIYGLDGVSAPWSSRRTVFVGTMEQIELSWTKATIRVRDRLAEIKRSIQPTLYKGTTTAGGKDEAEGTADDLKDRPKPLLWGVARNVPAILANRFDSIYQVSSRPLSAVQAVRDRGVALTFAQDYPTLAALRTATIQTGRYGTCLALGLIRPGTPPAGDLTVDATEGANGQRSAPLTARRMLEFAGLVAGRDFEAADFASLHALQPAEVGLWLPTEERDLLTSVSAIFDSIGAYIVPDNEGRLRVGRIDAPVGPAPVLNRTIIAADEAIERLATDDEGRGVPAYKITIQYAPAYLVQQRADLDQTASPEAVKAFASEAYRQAVAENAAIKTRNILATEMTFTTLLANEADAAAEAQRRLGVYGVRRDRYRVKLKTEELGAVRLGQIRTLLLPRFDLQAGKPFVVTKRIDDFSIGTTSLELYG